MATKAEQFVIDGLKACIPPGAPLMGKLMWAKFTDKTKAEASMILFDGKAALVEVSKWNRYAWAMQWLVLGGGAIEWTGTEWRRAAPTHRQLTLFDEAVT